MAVKPISVVLQAVTGPYQAAMARASAATTAFSTNVKGAAAQAGGMAQSTGMLNSKLVGGAGLLYGLKSVADSAVAWESAFTGVRKTVDGTEQQMASLEQGLRDMSTEIPVAATELAGIAEAAGQLGVETGNIEQFTEVMAQLGVTTNLTSDEAATSLARFANIMGTSQEDFDRLGSSIVELGNNFETTEAEIVTLGQRMAAAGKIAGLSEGDVFGFATALSSVGVEAEAGGTAMSKVFTAVNDAVIDGGDKLATFADVSGMTMSEFRTAFEQDGATAIATFIAGLGRISDAGGSTTQVFEALELTDQRLMRALLSTASAGDKLTDALESGNAAFEENNALQKEAELRFGTTESQMQMAKNAVEDLKVEIGQGLLPVLGEMATALNDALSFELPATGGMDVSGAIAGGLQQLLDPVGGLGRAVEDRLGRLNEESGEAAAAASELTDAEASLRRELEAVADITPEVADGADDIARSQQDMSAWVKDANDKIRHQIDLFREQTADPVTNLVDAIGAVEDATAAYNAAVEENGRGSEEAAEAGLELFEAVMDVQVAADSASGKFGGVENALMGMRDAGLLTADQVEDIIGLLDEARATGEQYEGTYQATVGLYIDPEVWSELRSLGRLVDSVTGRKDVSIGGTTQGGFIEGTRAGGGPVWPGTWLVGEDGPELLTVGGTGHVTPAPETAAILGGGTRVGSQTNVQSGAIQLVVRDEQAGMRAANRELKYMQLGYS